MLVDADYSIYGIRVGFILGQNRDVFGLDVALAHAVSGRMYGLQVGSINYANEVKRVQVGHVNIAKKVLGFQLGIINHTQELCGWQFGVLNFSRDRDGKQKVMPLINIG